MRVQRIVWFAIVFSTLLYGILAYAAERQYTLQPFMAMLLRPLALIVYAIALAVYVLSFFVASGVTRRAGAMSGFFVRLALLETVAVLGLVAAFVIHDWRLYLPAWGLALIGFLRAYPQGE